MGKLAFKQVDVFTRVPFRGNPVAVVLDGRGLSASEMQRIAAWTNLSETTFVLPPSAPEADYRLRIFTPRRELPFAGHPTIGSAHAVLEAGIAKPRQGKLRQECEAGVLELSVEGEVLWLKAPPATTKALDAAQRGDLEKTLGAPVIGAPVIVSVGPVWVVAELADAGAVDRLLPNMTAIGAFTEAVQATGITIFGKSGASDTIHVRSFAPAQGIPEDPVCGSGNISVAAVRGRSAGPYTARQGMQLGRDGRVSIRFEGEQILLGGSAVTCVDGTLRVEGQATPRL
ncbi:MAG TPA: PhzF family phenazine biosynthesis protein [Burkholderiales bacterium]|nr:PhzF family phenazine biosynthesis protein [Burkholderiales bacterium]